MPFLLLLFLTLGCFADQWQWRWAWVDSPLRSALVTASGMAAVIGLAALISYRVRCRLSREPARREAALQLYAQWRTYHLFALLTAYTLSLLVFGWGWAVTSPEAWGLSWFSEVIVLLPFFVALALSWACFYDAERALHRAGAADGPPAWSRWAYVGFHLRTNLALVCVPLALIIVQNNVLRSFPSLEPSLQVVILGLGVAAVLAVFACLPWILRLMLGLTPMPPGPLRERLLAAARRLNFRCNDILLWRTRGHVANAMVAGVLPWLRYVLLTDRLVTDLTPDEVEAVFGHEVGHVKHHHMAYYLGFLLGSLLILQWAATMLLKALQLSTDHGMNLVSLLAVAGAYIFVVFGFLSRRCERQADIYGCRTVSCGELDCRGHAQGNAPAPAGRGLCATGIRTFIDALEKVAHLNGISRDRPGWLQSWQHSTIARRVDFLWRVLMDPSEEPRFQRKVARVKWALGLMLAAGLMLVGLAMVLG
jgi:Zn-dependent protease with chaperone function